MPEITALRFDGRARDALRPVTIEPSPLAYAEGSALISIGSTRVLCAATIEEKVPPWLRGQGRGWVTAEYAMLPRATQERTQREAARGKIGGRTHEIQRLVGRALRAVTDLKLLGEKSVIVDCDVLHGGHHRRLRCARARPAPRLHAWDGEMAAGAADRRHQRRLRRGARAPRSRLRRG
jgi:ribonuclease PH